MLYDRRKIERHSINRIARLEWSHFTTCECQLVDISDRGARVYVERSDVPDEFVLTSFDADNSRVMCRVIWRLGYEIGTEFLQIQPGFARHALQEKTARASFGLRVPAMAPSRSVASAR